MDGQTEYPWFRLGLDKRPSMPADQIPTLDRNAIENTANYVPNKDLSEAVNVALALGMPLLLTGEPGTGKTQLASVVADQLGCKPLLKFETKSTSVARDLFYTFDAMTAFKMKDSVDPRQFITYQALGRAILEAFPANTPGLDKLLPPPGMGSYQHPGAPRRSVVLIDEVDKAPRDFPNDILNEIDRLTFRVPELLNAGSPGADADQSPIAPSMRPIIIMTSNSEKSLPDPFLRRCVYYHIDFPEKDQMAQIIGSRIASLKDSAMLNDALKLFFRLRGDGEDGLDLGKKPSTAELLNWLQALLQLGVTPQDVLEMKREEVLQTLSTLVKNSRDREDALEFIKTVWAQ